MEIINEDRLNDHYIKKWNEFVLNHPNGSFFQSPSAYHLYSNVPGTKPIIFIAIENNKVIGCLLATLNHDNNPLISYFSRRAIIEGGPLVDGDNPLIIKYLLKQLNRKLKGKVIYAQFRNSFDLSLVHEEFIQEGFYFEEHLNILVDLSKAESELWNDIHSKRRNEIRKGIKEGTTFTASQNIDDIQITYEILKQVYLRAKLPLPSIEYFMQAKHILGDEFKIFLAQFAGKTIGTMYTILFNNTIFDWYAGSFQEYYCKYPNDIIPWKVFIWGKENKYKTFDFGGAGNPSVPYGVREYKKKFGGSFTNFGRYSKVYNKVLYSLGKIGIKYYYIFK
jgi:lipid II:glycine glycyltransferase (peptidoglycan interpeptide bridge formation enzyme)